MQALIFNFVIWLSWRICCKYFSLFIRISDINTNRSFCFFSLCFVRVYSRSAVIWTCWFNCVSRWRSWFWFLLVIEYFLINLFRYLGFWRGAYSFWNFVFRFRTKILWLWAFIFRLGAFIFWFWTWVFYLLVWMSLLFLNRYFFRFLFYNLLFWWRLLYRLNGHRFLHNFDIRLYFCCRFIILFFHFFKLFWIFIFYILIFSFDLIFIFSWWDSVN